MTEITIVVMAKRSVVGHVKTRLIGRLSAEQAAEVHRMMLECVLCRAAAQIVSDRQQLVLALDDVFPPPAAEPIDAPNWLTVGQGKGDLGDRLTSVWRRIGRGPAVFLGVDSPDVPSDMLRSIVPALSDRFAAIGRAADGGYWTLAARSYEPRLLTGIDWGGDAVYHQTQMVARAAAIGLHELGPWYDVDTYEDLKALQERLIQTSSGCHQDRALQQLQCGLSALAKELPNEQP